MKIISYNVNGIRAAINKNFLDWLQVANPDVLLLQEVKALPEQIDVLQFKEIGYNIYIHSAQKKGYSGVAIISKNEPKNVVAGIGISHIDAEGRVLRADFDDFSVISVYVPSGTNIDRLGFKLDFGRDFLHHIKALQAQIKNLVIGGDFNVCHHAIDIHDPVRNASVSGFLPIEREWLSLFMTENKLLDTFRHLNKEPHNYSWWSYRANARNNNKGWRIDYTMITQSLEKNLQRAFILPEAKHSDHCPVGIELKF